MQFFRRFRKMFNVFASEQVKMLRSMTLRSKYGAGGGNRTRTGISPKDFESSSSTSSNTPAYLMNTLLRTLPKKQEGYTGGMLMKLEPLYQKSNEFATPFPELGEIRRNTF